MFKVIICGSREFSDYELLRERCDYYLKDKLLEPEGVTIVSGCARGADTLGERYAIERGLPVLKFPADWEKYGKRAGYIRNAQMAEVGNACLAFLKSGAENKGTKNMISLARSGNLLVREVTGD